jgi:hypothetical protein
MSAPKISAMENEPRNLTIGTLIRVAHYGNGPSRLPSFLRASREEKSKPAASANTSGAQATRFKPKLRFPANQSFRGGHPSFCHRGKCRRILSDKLLHAQRPLPR